MGKTIEQSIRDVLDKIVEREHKYHTTDYDGVVGVTDEDVQELLNIIEGLIPEKRLPELRGGEIILFDGKIRVHIDELPRVSNNGFNQALTEIRERLKG